MPRTVTVAADRYPAWRERFKANNVGGPQRIVEVREPLPGPLAVLLIRRGGYALALVGDDRRPIAHKVGTRHVQSRTAAGGWSQQRFARRRANQADALVAAVQDHLQRLLEDAGAVPVALVTGGDRRLVADVLADARLARLGDLSGRAYPDLPDPRRSVLDDVVRRATAYEIVIEDDDRSVS